MLTISNTFHEAGPYWVARLDDGFAVVKESAIIKSFPQDSHAPIDKAIALRRAMDEADRLAAAEEVVA